MAKIVFIIPTTQAEKTFFVMARKILSLIFFRIEYLLFFIIIAQFLQSLVLLRQCLGVVK